MKVSDEQFISKEQFQKFVMTHIIYDPYLNEDCKIAALRDAEMAIEPQGFYMTFFVETKLGVHPQHRTKLVDDFDGHVRYFASHSSFVREIEQTDMFPADGWDDGSW